MIEVLWFSVVFFFFKQKTAYDMRISDWSSDVCSSDLVQRLDHAEMEHAERTATRQHQCRTAEAGGGPLEELDLFVEAEIGKLANADEIEAARDFIDVIADQAFGADPRDAVQRRIRDVAEIDRKSVV